MIHDLSSAAVFLTLLWQVPSGPPSTILHVAGWTTSSERIDKIWVVMSSLSGREKYTGTGRDVALSVPTGEYILQVEAPGFESRRQIVKAYGPEVFRTIALPIIPMHGQKGSSLAGKIRDYKGDSRKLRVRLMALYGDEVRESILDADAAFRFPVDPGAYLFLVVADLESGPTIVDSRPLYIKGEEIVTIDLKNAR